MELTLNILALTLEERIWLILRNLHPKEPIECPIEFDQLGNRKRTPRLTKATQMLTIEFEQIGNPKPEPPEKSVSSGNIDNVSQERVQDLLHLEPTDEKSAKHTSDRKV